MVTLHTLTDRLLYKALAALPANALPLLGDAIAGLVDEAVCRLDSRAAVSFVLKVKAIASD